MTDVAKRPFFNANNLIRRGYESKSYYGMHSVQTKKL